MGNQIVEFNQFEADLAEYRARYEGVVYDFGEAAQEKQARSDRLAIGKKVAELDRVHKMVKSPLLERVQLLDGERKRIKDGLLEVQDGIKGQIARHEAELKAIEDALLAKVQAIRDFADIDEHNASSDQVLSRIAAAVAVVIDESYGKYEFDAALAQVEAVDALQSMVARVRQREEEVAELARVRAELAAREQAEREERIARAARESAEKEAREAQARELEALRAERQARIDAEHAVAAAKKAAEDAARQAEFDKDAAVEQATRDAERRQREQAALGKAQQGSGLRHPRPFDIFKDLSDWCKKHSISEVARVELGEIVSQYIPPAKYRESA